MKICINCEYFRFNYEEGYYYSEYTWSGASFECRCKRGYFDNDQESTTLNELRRLICRAEMCEEYTPIEGEI